MWAKKIQRLLVWQSQGCLTEEQESNSKCLLWKRGTETLFSGPSGQMQRRTFDFDFFYQIFFSLGCQLVTTIRRTNDNWQQCKVMCFGKGLLHTERSTSIFKMRFSGKKNNKKPSYKNYSWFFAAFFKFNLTSFWNQFSSYFVTCTRRLHWLIRKCWLHFSKIAHFRIDYKV